MLRKIFRFPMDFILNVGGFIFGIYLTLRYGLDGVLQWKEEVDRKNAAGEYWYVDKVNTWFNAVIWIAAAVKIYLVCR